jgi:branched-chain amino acid transport system ATP-binding protein
VFENALIGGLARGDALVQARAVAGDTLRLMELWDKRNQKAGSLTLPDRKRLEVARALATGPRLLLLDEVMAGLRPTETDRMVAVLRMLNRERGVTLVLIEHVMRAVMALAGRIHVLHHGATIAEGAPEVVTRDPAVISSYLGTETLG